MYGYNGFEKAAMRIMVLIVLGCVLLLYLQLISCTNSPNGAINLSPKNPKGPQGYELKGFHGQMHRYKEDISAIPLSDFPSVNRYLTQFCLKHHSTECISLRITNINNEKKTNYIMNDCRGRK